MANLDLSKLPDQPEGSSIDLKLLPDQPKVNLSNLPDQPKEGNWQGWIKPSLEEVGRGIAATPETAATLATGLVAMPLAGVAGLGKLLTSGSLQEATKTIESVSEGLTYHPKQKTSQESAGLAMKPIEWMQKARDIVGDYVYKETGNPDWAAAAATTFELGSYVLAGKVGGMATPKGIPELKPWAAKISPEAFVEMQKERILQNIKDSKAIPDRPLRDIAMKERQLKNADRVKTFYTKERYITKPENIKQTPEVVPAQRPVPFKPEIQPKPENPLGLKTDEATKPIEKPKSRTIGEAKPEHKDALQMKADTIANQHGFESNPKRWPDTEQFSFTPTEKTDPFWKKRETTITVDAKDFDKIDQILADKKQEYLDVEGKKEKPTKDLISALEEKEFYGTIDRLKRGVIDEEQARGELEGTAKPKIPEVKKVNPAELASKLKSQGIERQASYSQYVKAMALKPEMDAKAWYKIWDSVTPTKSPIGGGETLSFMGTQQAYEKAVESVKWLKEAAKAFGEGMHDAIDVEAPLKRMGAPKTAFAQKNIYSRMAKEEELGLYDVRKNAKLFDFDKSVAPDVALSAEDPQYFNRLPKDIKDKIRPAVNDLNNYFKESQKEYAQRGIRIDFKQRILDDLNNLIDLAEKQGIKKPEAARKLKELKEAREIAKRMNFVHIPSAMWFEDFMGKDPAGASKALKLLATQKRKSLTIQSLIDRGLIKKEDVHPGDIIASYARRKGRDFALLEFVDAARKEGLASLTKQPDMVQVPGYIAPVLGKYWVKKPLADIVYDMSRTGKMSKFDKVIAATKMMQFYNPLFLPMYDVVQQAMLVGPKYYKMPKYWKEGIKDVWNKTPEYWESLDNGIASKPFNAPWDEFQESLKYAKMSSPEIAKAVASDIFSPKMLKTIYHGSWRIAWELDKTTRMVTNRYLLDQGFSPKEAAQIAAKYHSDYASVPPATRRALNKVFFTPTFKITMGKLFGNMVKDSLKGVAKMGKINPTSKAYAKGLINTFAILEAYDLFMTKSLGFKRDEWARRYIKPGVNTPDGEKELVVIWSSPANMFLKYIYRGQIAARQGELTQRVRSFIEMNKWEFHPIWRTLYDEFWTNKTPSGDEIVNAFDPPMIKAVKRIKHFTKSMVAVTGLIDKDTMDSSARKRFAKETSKAFEFLTRPFLFKYMRGPKNQRLRYQFEQTKKKFMRDLHNGKITPERFDTFQKEINNIINQLGGK